MQLCKLSNILTALLAGGTSRPENEQATQSFFSAFLLPHTRGVDAETIGHQSQASCCCVIDNLFSLVSLHQFYTNLDIIILQ